MSKTLTEKYSNLNVHLDKVVNEANAEISNCYNKLHSKMPIGLYSQATTNMW